MAQQGGAVMVDDPKQQEFIRSRQRTYGGFITFTVWTTAGIILLLILLAIFLV